MINLPRVYIAHLPTPIEYLSRLTSYLGGPRIYVKRDDQTGLAFGGNKTRKLEFLVAEARASGAKTLITTGAVQSNHCRQTAAAAAKFGFKCTLVLAGGQPESITSNYLLDLLLGANVVWTDRSSRDDDLKLTFLELESKDERPYLVPYGGSSPTGAAAYAYAIKELMDQRIQPDWIVFPTSSGGTQAGLVAGARLLGFKGRILGISVDEAADQLKIKIAQLASEVISKLGIQDIFDENEILVNSDYCEPGYGVLTHVETEAIKLFAREEGLLLDPVYTGRAAGGLIDLIRKDYFSPSDTALFWHTGGTPALFAQKYGRTLGKI